MSELAQGHAAAMHKCISILSQWTKLSLKLVPGSTIYEDGVWYATATSDASGTSTTPLAFGVVAKLFGCKDQPNAAAWVLAFFYVNGARVAAAGSDYLSFRIELLEGDHPKVSAEVWESDAYGEWEELKNLP